MLLRTLGRPGVGGARNAMTVVNGVVAMPRAFSTFSRSGQTPTGGRRGRVNKIHFGITIVPQQTAWVVERLGKFSQILDGGLHFLIPFVDRISYIHSMKEEAVLVPNQQAITKDNVNVHIDGVLYVQIDDAYKASYGVHDPIYALIQLAQTTMRSEIGKLSLDRLFEDRMQLNQAIVAQISEAAEQWGIQCKRYEIKDIVPPDAIRNAMEMEAEAERKRRADVLISEGERMVQINLAEAQKKSVLLAAEGAAEATVLKATAEAKGLEMIGTAIQSPKGHEAASLRCAEQWIKSWEELGKKGGQTIIVPANTNDAAAMTTQAMSIFKSLSGNNSFGDSRHQK